MRAFGRQLPDDRRRPLRGGVQREPRAAEAVALGRAAEAAALGRRREGGRDCLAEAASGRLPYRDDCLS